MASLLVPAGEAGTTCLKKKPFNTQIEVTVEIPDPRYNQRMSVAELTEKGKEGITEWKSEHEDHVWASQDLYIQGVARGGVGVSTRSQIIGKPFGGYGLYYCPYIRRISVLVYYNTQIFIAKEHKKGTCRFDAVMEHEFKHHDTNVKAVYDVTEKLKKDLPQIISFMERRYITKAEAEGGFKNLEQGIDDALKIYSEYMFEEMEKRNKFVDTPEEYERVSALCPR